MMRKSVIDEIKELKARPQSKTALVHKLHLGDGMIRVPQHFDWLPDLSYERQQQLTTGGLALSFGCTESEGETA
jgi:hypothetical protein